MSNEDLKFAEEYERCLFGAKILTAIKDKLTDKGSEELAKLKKYLDENLSKYLLITNT